MLILKIVNMVFAVLFTIEMLLKWVAFGLWRYFTSAWTCLDFVIVCVSYYALSFITIRGSPLCQDLILLCFSNTGIHSQLGHWRKCKSYSPSVIANPPCFAASSSNIPMARNEGKITSFINLWTYVLLKSLSPIRQWCHDIPIYIILRLLSMPWCMPFRPLSTCCWCV